MEIFKISAATIGKRGSKLLQGSMQELERVAESNSLSLLDLEGFLHVLTDNFDVAVRSLSKFVVDEMCILATNVREEHWYFKAYWARQIALPVGIANKPARDVVVGTDFGAIDLAFYELVTTNVAARKINLLVLLAGTQTFHRPIFLENRHDLGFQDDKRVEELGERVLLDFHHGFLVNVIKTRGDDCCFCANFVLLGVCGVLYLTHKLLKEGLKVNIDDEWRLSTIHVLFEFNVHFFWARCRKYMKHRHKVDSSAKLFVAS